MATPLAERADWADYQEWLRFHQGHRQKATCKILVDGTDVTDAFEPHLISVQTIERSGSADGGDTASIELDDRDGRLAIPPPNRPIEIELGWAYDVAVRKWTGVVKDPESTFSRRGGGRRLYLECQAWTPFGSAGDRVSKSWGEGERPPQPGGTVQFHDWDHPPKEYTLEEVLQDAGKAAGFDVKLSPSMRAIARKYWSQENESFLAFGARLARETGGKFKVAGTVATLVHATDGYDAEGNLYTTIPALWGANLINWRIKPFSATPQAARAASWSYNRRRGLWERYDQVIPGDPPFGLSRAVTSLPAPAPNKQTAEQWNVALREGSLTERGVGSVTINGEPHAWAAGRLVVKGARAGVDGAYTINEVEQVYGRSGGWLTTLSVSNPQPTYDDIVYGKPWGWMLPPAAGQQ